MHTSNHHIAHYFVGSIVIEPFDQRNLSTSSYDVTLGPYFFRETPAEPGVIGIYNPYSESHVHKIWGEPHYAETAGEWMARTGLRLDNIANDDRIIWISPGE